jgi:uncharacterized protein YccT (UPF0319 family)
VFTIRAASLVNGCLLEELYLTACSLITPLAIHQLVQRCPMLQLLVLDGCKKILGSFVGQLATYKVMNKINFRVMLIVLTNQQILKY